VAAGTASCCRYKGSVPTTSTRSRTDRGQAWQRHHGAAAARSGTAWAPLERGWSRPAGNRHRSG
jgi:hypothetical protein